MDEVEVRIKLVMFKNELKSALMEHDARIRRLYHGRSFVVNPDGWEALKKVLNYKQTESTMPSDTKKERDKNKAAAKRQAAARKSTPSRSTGRRRR